MGCHVSEITPVIRRLVLFTITLIGATALLTGCITSKPVSSTPPPLLLISMDGFRWDYCQRYPSETVHLRALMKEGAVAKGLIPVFPSQTFANHYSIVTGLYPSHHGIINNV